MHKTGCFARALYARGRGPHYADIITEKASKRHFIKLPENVKTTGGMLLLSQYAVGKPICCG